MQKFIAEQNITNFRAQLAVEQDEERRAFLRRLISEEEVKLRQAERDPGAGSAPRGEA